MQVPYEIFEKIPIYNGEYYETRRVKKKNAKIEDYYAIRKKF